MARMERGIPEGGHGEISCKLQRQDPLHTRGGRRIGQSRRGGCRPRCSRGREMARRQDSEEGYRGARQDSERGDLTWIKWKDHYLR